MNKTLVVLASVLFGLTFSTAQLRVAAKYNYPLLPGTATDSVLHGLSSIRGCAYDPDIDGDGKPEIALTNYNGTGRIHVFRVINIDSMQLVWTSPPLLAGTGSGNISPRVVIFGDLDNDGRREVITQIGAQGIYIFEWDGVVGSDNFGTVPSQVITAPNISGTAGNAEYMEVLDIDGDGQNELLVAYNATTNANDKFYIFSANGGWDTDNPGFSSFNVEFVGDRVSLAKYGLGGGSPVAMISANFDGTGNKEVLIHSWDRKAVGVMRVPSANTYLLADTASQKVYVNLSGADDDVALFGGFAYDIDHDGRDEVYLPTWYSNTGSSHAGYVHMIYYNPGSATSTIDSATNVASFDLTGVIGTPDEIGYNSNLLGFGYGDVEGTGKRHLYFSGIDFISSGFNIVSMEFQGGDKRNQANWKTSILYRADPAVDSAMTIRDSLGSVDTTRVRWAAQIAKMYARGIDIDKDGKEEMLLPYQGWWVNPDSIAITKLKWNTGTSRYDTTKSNIANPNRWTFRILKRGTSTGVEAKDPIVITPDDYRLEQNYPNPFNPTTRISFSLPVDGKVSLIVYDLLGREVRRLVDNQDYRKGTHETTWNGTNSANQQVASGPYVYTLKFGNFSKSEKMMLLR